MAESGGGSDRITLTEERILTGHLAPGGTERSGVRQDHTDRGAHPDRSPGAWGRARSEVRDGVTMTGVQILTDTDVLRVKREVRKFDMAASI